MRRASFCAALLAAFLAPGLLAEGALAAPGTAASRAPDRVGVDDDAGPVQLARRRKPKKRKADTPAASDPTPSEPEPAAADPEPSGPAPSGPSTPDDGLQRTRNGPSRIEFDDRLIQGQTNKANAIYLFERRASELRTLVKTRKHYHREMDEMLEQ